MPVRNFCCLIVLLINLSCTVYMKTTPIDFVCDNDTVTAVKRHDKTFAKATKVHRTLGPLRELAKTKGHQTIAATTKPPATTKVAVATNRTTTAATTEQATTKTIPTTPPSITTTVDPSTTKSTTHTTSTTTKTAPAITKAPISTPVTSKTPKTKKDTKKKLGISSTTTKATNSFTPISKALFSNGKWKLPEVDPPGTWLF